MADAPYRRGVAMGAEGGRKGRAMQDNPDTTSRRRGPPWIDPAIQQRIEWRDGDVVVSVPPKSGTTWTMNIVHQLLTGGTDAFHDIYAEVPWIEFLSHPQETHQAVADRVAAMHRDRRRAFKSHSAPPDVPFVAQDDGPDVKYVVICRNPEEALVSFRPFLAQHSEEWHALWGMPHGLMTRPDFPSFYWDVIDANAMQARFFGFLQAWWPLRNRQNVLFLHYSDMKRDHEGSIRQIARFIKADPTPAQWPRILEYTSFAWMKRHESKFEARSIAAPPILRPGAMIRKGAAGAARSDGMTEEISAHLEAAGRRICPDAAAVDWFYNGGALP